MNRSISIKHKIMLAVLIAALPALESAAEVRPFPAEFRETDMAVSDGTQHVRIGGKGPAVVLLHGFGDTGDMW